MNWHFYQYFLTYIFKAKTRQRLLLIAVVGLLVSSFSLVVLQGVMGGLQSGLIKRSKTVMGYGHLTITSEHSWDEILVLIDHLQALNVALYPEYEIELMLKKDTRLSPLILHGLDFRFGIPPFLKNKDNSSLILGSDLSNRVNAYFESKIQLISPAHVDSLFGDIPRQVTSKVSDFYMSELQEIDGLHGWVNIKLVQNLIRKKAINKINFFDQESLVKTQKFLAQNKLPYKLVTWESMNQSLVWALNLETNVMLFLFIGMSFLVAICITSGFMIFFDKIKTDLISFWILGKSQQELFKLSYLFTHLVSLLFASIGLLAGIGFLWLLEQNKLNIMPDFFVERRIPVKLNTWTVLISFIIPYGISVTFAYFSFSIFKRETNSFLNIIRNAR
jgi:lipoprotein-releasing system permease protein